MSIALITRGMVCFGVFQQVSAVAPCVESSVTMVRETNIPNISAVSDVKPSMSSETETTDVRPTISRITVTRPKIS